VVAQTETTNTPSLDEAGKHTGKYVAASRTRIVCRACGNASAWVDYAQGNQALSQWDRANPAPRGTQ
jgi:hypothetical protein